jgi:hypothetical protein
MIQMENAESNAKAFLKLDEQQKKCDGIGSARDSHAHTITSAEHLVLGDERPNTFGQRGAH